MAQAMTDVEESRCDLWTAQKDDRPHIRPESIDSGHLLPREKAFLRNLYPLLLGVGHPPRLPQRSATALKEGGKAALEAPLKPKFPPPAENFSAGGPISVDLLRQI